MEKKLETKVEEERTKRHFTLPPIFARELEPKETVEFLRSLVLKYPEVSAYYLDKYGKKH